MDNILKTNFDHGDLVGDSTNKLSKDDLNNNVFKKTKFKTTLKRIIKERKWVHPLIILFVTLLAIAVGIVIAWVVKEYA